MLVLQNKMRTIISFSLGKKVIFSLRVFGQIPIQHTSKPQFPVTQAQHLASSLKIFMKVLSYELFGEVLKHETIKYTRFEKIH